MNDGGTPPNDGLSPADKIELEWLKERLGQRAAGEHIVQPLSEELRSRIEEEIRVFSGEAPNREGVMHDTAEGRARFFREQYPNATRETVIEAERGSLEDYAREYNELPSDQRYQKEPYPTTRESWERMRRQYENTPKGIRRVIGFHQPDGIHIEEMREMGEVQPVFTSYVQMPPPQRRLGHPR